MSASLDDVVYNPALLPRARCGQALALHHGLSARLLAQLARDPGPGAPQHHVILGGPGSGKTMLLRGLGHAIEDDPTLARHWLPLAFPEAQYGVGGLADLWTESLDYLAVALDRRGDHTLAADIRRATRALPQDDATREEEALALLRDSADALDRRFVLLVDNLDVVLSRLDQASWRFREILSAEPRLAFIAASARMIEATYRYDAAFYDFFQIHELNPVRLDHAREALDALAGPRQPAVVADYDARYPGGLDATFAFLGTHARALALVRRQLLAAPDTPPDCLVAAVLDWSTPELSARIDSQAPQSQRVLHAVATAWDPIRAGDVAARCHLPTNVASAQLNRLAKDGMVEKVAYPPGTRLGFQVRDRRFGVWMLLRAGQPHRGRVLGMVPILADALAPDPTAPAYHPFVVAAGLLRLGRWPEAERLLVEALPGAVAGGESADRHAVIALLGAALAFDRLTDLSARVEAADERGRWLLVTRAAQLVAGDDDVIALTAPELRRGVEAFAARIRDASEDAR